MIALPINSILRACSCEMYELGSMLYLSVKAAFQSSSY